MMNRLKEAIFADVDEEKLRLMADQLAEIAQMAGETFDDICDKFIKAFMQCQKLLQNDFAEMIEKEIEEAAKLDKKDEYPVIIPEKMRIRSTNVFYSRKYMVHPRFKNRPPGKTTRQEIKNRRKERNRHDEQN